MPLHLQFEMFYKYLSAGEGILKRKPGKGTVHFGQYLVCLMRSLILGSTKGVATQWDDNFRELCWTGGTGLTSFSSAASSLHLPFLAC